MAKRLYACFFWLKKQKAQNKKQREREMNDNRHRHDKKFNELIIRQILFFFYYFSSSYYMNTNYVFNVGKNFRMIIFTRKQNEKNVKKSSFFCVFF